MAAERDMELERRQKGMYTSLEAILYASHIRSPVSLGLVAPVGGTPHDHRRPAPHPPSPSATENCPPFVSRRHE